MLKKSLLAFLNSFLNQRQIRPGSIKPYLRSIGQITFRRAKGRRCSFLSIIVEQLIRPSSHVSSSSYVLGKYEEHSSYKSYPRLCLEKLLHFFPALQTSKF